MQSLPKLFLVEDNTFYRTWLQAELAEAGYDQVLAFSDGKSCLEALYHLPQVVLLDHNLPQETGLEILKQIKAFDPDIQVIFLSGQETLAVAVDSLKYGAFDYVPKNDEAALRLPLTIRKALEHSALLARFRQRERRKRRLTHTALTAVAASLLLTLLATCI